MTFLIAWNNSQHLCISAADERIGVEDEIELEFHFVGKNVEIFKSGKCQGLSRWDECTVI